MEILIAGGTGFIGRALVQHFNAKQARCIIISQSTDTVKKIFGEHAAAVQWEDEKALVSAIKSANVVFNLAGANIGDKRWTQERKEEILLSRINSTRILAELCASLQKNSPPLFNASAIGIYGLQQSEPQGLPPALDENTPLDFSASAPDFLAEVGRQWEMATSFAKEAGVRVVNMRFAPVLGKTGGILEKLKKPFLFGLGGKIGDGRQPFSWIALPDLIQAIEFLFARPYIAGPVNFVAPECVVQEQFAKELAQVLHRPSFAKLPAAVVKIIFGQMGEELLLRGQHVIPTRLLKEGFVFKYPALKQALSDLFS